MALKQIELICGTRRELFEESHANRILAMRNNGGWKLAPQKKKKNDTKPTANKGQAPRKEEERND